MSHSLSKHKLHQLYALTISIVFLFLVACKTPAPIAAKPYKIETHDTLLVEPSANVPLYQSSATKTHDMVHLHLEVSFDWAKTTLSGKEVLTLKPHFYPTSSLTLDARGMLLHEVALLNKKGQHKPLNYTYQNDQLLIDFGKTYAASDTLKLFIDYTAQPNELKKKGGSNAITDDKGLYFINPDGSDKTKPRQIWTQGETQSNSVWFPCIDRPNQKFTQDIAITVENQFVTLSNGLLVKQQSNKDGTRTDFWKQTLPHSPYLVMMVVGNFAIVKDQWHGKEVSYYVEPEYEAYARSIFGKTPEMLEFFSNKLGIPYVWDKYAQVVVHDYVSGAMENTSATLFGDFMDQTDREQLDHNYEDVVAHELFHHWFGDLVTCESWSNLPVNESFADYGEYLWMEYKYGRNRADGHLYRSTQKYYSGSRFNQVNVVRYFYNDKEEMFDVNTYEKGGAILHMLRKYVGDEAFFAALHKYLTDHQFKNAEIAQLRLAFEEVTGEDLNWFFNQWFLASGYPHLKVTHDYDKEKGIYNLHVEQVQNLKTTPLYHLPIDVDVYSETGKIERKRIWITQRSQDIELLCPTEPLLVNFDAEKMLLGEVDELSKPIRSMVYQYRNAPLFEDRLYALDQLDENYPKSEEFKSVLVSALHDASYDIRSHAITLLQGTALAHDNSIVKPIMELVQYDTQSAVRCDALQFLVRNFLSSDLKPIFEKALKDPSYLVAGNALTSLAILDKEAAFKAASTLESTDEDQLLINIMVLYSQYGADTEYPYFVRLENQFSGYAKINYIECLSDFLQRCGETTIAKSVPLWSRLLKDSNRKAHKTTLQAIKDLYNEVNKRTQDFQSPEHQALLNQLEQLTAKPE